MFQSVTDAEPGGNGVPALHPAENPWNGAEVFQLASFGAAGRTRADARAIEFIDGRGLLEIFEHVGVLRDLLTIDLVRFLGNLFDSFFPLGVCGRSGAGQSFQAGGDHQFQIPFRQNWVGIFPVEDFALLGHADLPRETARRLRQNR